MHNRKLALIHLSQFFSVMLVTFVLSITYSNGLIVAPAFSGAIIPFVIWILFRNDKTIDYHCREIFDWEINILFVTILCIPLLLTYYGMYCLLLILVLTLLYDFGVAWRVFLGKTWHYPSIIRFFHKSPLTHNID